MDITLELLQKFGLFTNAIKERFPNVTFVGIIQQAGNKNWDLVVAGDSLRNETNFGEIAGILRNCFQENELILFSALVVIDSTSLVIDQIRRSIAVMRDPVIIENTRFLNIYIEKAYIFYSLPLGRARI